MYLGETEDASGRRRKQEQSGICYRTRLGVQGVRPSGKADGYLDRKEGFTATDSQTECDLGGGANERLCFMKLTGLACGDVRTLCRQIPSFTPQSRCGQVKNTVPT